MSGFKPLPFLFLIFALVVTALAIHRSGFNAGVNKTKLKYETEISIANTRNTSLEDKLVEAQREQERQSAEAINKIAAAYIRGKEDAEKDSVDTIINTANGSGGLSVNVRRDESPAVCGSTDNTVATSKHNGTQRARLSEEDARFFISEAKRADAVTRQLGACQQVVYAYREAVTKYQDVVEDILSKWPKK